MACRQQHEDHGCGGHSHGGHDGGHGGHDHGNRYDDEAGAVKDSLYNVIDTPKVRAFNEHRHDACKDVIKPWHQKLDTEKYMSSDVDADLIIYIPFTEVVKLRSIVIIGGDNGEAPDKMRAFINREDVDFDRANNSVALQEWDLVENSQHGKLEYTTKYSKFSSVCSLTLHFPSNFGADISTIFFIGLRGETTRVTTKQVIMNTVYESAPNVKDHKVDDATSMDVSPGM
uniref:PITH domain-containing protein n=1 Tax=Eutreptiella gymnastica TaxID=73025 RepID=A0A7S4LBH9_9EUGL|mmetsp:Transcript_78004/g.131026  ORF Transcript_78004/g.131026 Transcript_78004/m.131026 type:complete len:229 (+) Transcript_78004:24-710(+)